MSGAADFPADGVAVQAQSSARWSRRVGYAAATWSWVYGLLGVWWSFGGDFFPYGRSGGDPGGDVSLLIGVTRSAMAPVIAVVGLFSGVVAFALARGWARRVPVALVLGYVTVLVLTIAFVICDYRVLANVGYALMLQFGGLGLPVWNQYFCLLGAVLWTVAAVVHQRARRNACLRCGRADTSAGTEEIAMRWGRWATGIAVVVPILYAITRWAWALGIPLGISADFLREGQENNIWVYGAGLATLGVGGAILTLGLVQRWGEIFPRWIPFLRGQRVAPLLAIVPAALVAVIVTIAGVMYVRIGLTGGFGDGSEWAAFAPELLWPLWGIALGVATLAYYFRRRGACRTCHRR